MAARQAREKAANFVKRVGSDAKRISSNVQKRISVTISGDPADTLMVVTGATGYIAAFVVQMLLDRGYRVRGTVRSLASEEKVAHLRSMPGAEERLQLVEMDMTQPESFRVVMIGVDVLIHMATPVDIPMDDDSMFKTEEEAYERQINPAVEGTKALMRAASEANVSKIVLTSSSAAMMVQDPPPTSFDVSSWSDIEMLRANLLAKPNMAYFLAKTLQEQGAREVALELDLKLATICPFLVVGPTLLPRSNISHDMIATVPQGKGFVFAESPEGTIPDGYMGIVDVREVAEAHVLAAEKPKATGRYLLISNNVHFQDMARMMREGDEKLHAFPEFPLHSADGERHATEQTFDNGTTRALGVAEIPIEDTLTEAAHTIANFM